MSLTWRGKVGCDTCGNYAPCVFRLTHERKIEITLLDSKWIIRTIGNDDSNRDVNSVDVDGDRYEVLCPDHIPQRRPR